MKKITLYDPQVIETEKEFVYMPLELLAISCLIYKDYEIKIFDHTDDVEKIVESAKDSVCFGITALTGFQIADGLKVAKALRKENPNVPIVWGGWHTSLLPEQSLENEYVDIIIKGQGERTFYELIKALDKGKSLKGILGLSYKEKDKIIHNPDRPFIDLNKFPRLPYHLIDVEKYLIEDHYGKRVISYISSQGCPYNCAFCADRAVYKGNWRGLSAKRVLDDLKFLKENYKIDGVRFLDNNFFFNEERDREIMNGLIKLNLGWGTVLGRVNVLFNYSNDTWRLMKKSKLYSFLIGAESGLDNSLIKIQKGFSVKDTFKFFEKCKKYDIGVVSSWFVGMPNMSRGYLKKDFDATVDLMYRVWKMNRKKNEFLFYTYIPFPGSPFYELSKKEGFVEPKSLEEWSRYNCVDNIRKVKIFVPWIDKKYSKLIEMIPFYFSFASKKYRRQIRKRFRSPFKQILLGLEVLFRKIVELRLKTKIFTFPLEYDMLDGFIRFKRQKMGKTK